jgi:hypothetical protein
MDDVIDIELKVDIKKLRETIESALDLNDNQQLFEQLIEFERVKKQVADIVDSIKSIEVDAKGLIASKANALYTDKWEAIKGKHYKITKSPTGSVFIIDGEPENEFVVIKKSLDTKLVNNYIKDNGKLPSGVQYNDARGTSIRINVSDDEN